MWVKLSCERNIGGITSNEYTVGSRTWIVEGASEHVLTRNSDLHRLSEYSNRTRTTNNLVDFFSSSSSFFCIFHFTKINFRSKFDIENVQGNHRNWMDFLQGCLPMPRPTEETKNCNENINLSINYTNDWTEKCSNFWNGRYQSNE